MTTKDQDIERVKDDLSTIKQATGMGLSFGWADVYGELMVAAVLLLGGPWTILPRNYSIAKMLYMLMMILTCAILLVLRIRFRRSSGKSPSRRRLYTFSILMMPVCVVLLRLYTRYLLPKLNLSPSAMMASMGALLFGLGLGLSIALLMNRQHISSLPVSITVAIIGLSVPFCPLSHLLVFILTSAGFSVAAMAGIEARMLMKAGIPHGTD